MLCVEDLSYVEKQGRLLQGLNFTVEPGEVLAVIGPNGAGKSSLLRCLSGEWQVEGRILLGGRSLSECTRAERARRLAVLPQFSELGFPFTVREVVALGRLPHETGAELDRDIVDQCLQELDLLALAERSYLTLSGGEQQRVHLARVFAQVWRAADAQGGRILLLDEPCAALDIAHTQQLMNFLGGFARQGAAVIVTLHDFNLALRFADAILALKGGQQLAYGAPAEVMTTSTIERLFSVATSSFSHPRSGQLVVLIDD